MARKRTTKKYTRVSTPLKRKAFGILFVVISFCLGILVYHLYLQSNKPLQLIDEVEEVQNVKWSPYYFYELTIHYPLDSKQEVQSENEREIVNTKANLHLTMKVFDNPNNISEVEFVNRNYSALPSEAIKDYTNNNMNGIQFLMNNNIHTIFSNHNLTYELVIKSDKDTPPSNSAINLFDQMLSKAKFLDQETNIKLGQPEANAQYFNGDISDRIPFKGLKFVEINVNNFSPTEKELNQADYHFGNLVMDGYTFTAKKGESFEFLAQEDWSSGARSYIETQLYGYGPTVIKMGTRTGWEAPVTGRYFYVVIGNGSFNGENSPYGKYTLSIK